MMAFEKPQRVGGEAERGAPRMKVGDPCEERRVERQPRLVRCQLWRVIAGDLFERIVAVARLEVEEDAAYPLQQPAGALQCRDRVGKAWRLGRSRDRRDLGVMLGHAAVEGRRKMLRTDEGEGRQAVGRRPLGKKRVCGHWSLSGRCCPNSDTPAAPFLFCS